MSWWRHWLMGRRSNPSWNADLRRRIRASFNEAADDEENFPSSIDPRIVHVRLILDHLGDISRARVLDAGCGKGRFARVLQGRFPAASFVGLDIAESMLRCLPGGVHPCLATLTELPFADGSFDAAYATESLEHAVEIETAVSELCRVVRPGGRLAIIDKNRAQWGRLKTPEWERWFGRRELERLLRRDCRRVTSRYVSYWEDVRPDGLFLAWLAER